MNKQAASLGARFQTDPAQRFKKVDPEGICLELLQKDINDNKASDALPNYSTRVMLTLLKRGGFTLMTSCHMVWSFL